MEGITLYTSKALHIGYPWMLGRIIIVDFHEGYYIVTVRYTEKDIDDKEFKVFKTEDVGEPLCRRVN